MLVAHLVVKNEADRYLHDCLSALSKQVDYVHVFDDRSEDETPYLADRLGAEVHVRPSDYPSFLDHEGQFRQAAWESMGTLPQDAWVVCVDADEFFDGDLRPHATGMNKMFHVQEIFDVVGSQPLQRIDGYWDQITAARLVPWTADSDFPDRAIGCGSLPESLASQPFELLEEPKIIHYGYAKPRDREVKYRRYKSRRGHNPKHVNSILWQGDLRPL